MIWRRHRLVLAVLSLSSISWTEEIYLSIDETSGTARKAAFVCTGIPLGRGVVKSADVRLTSLLGRELPAFIRPLTYWPDGSIKWLRIQTQTSLAAKERKSLILKNDRPANPVSGRWKEESADDLHRVSNGLLTIEFGSSGAEFIRSIRVDDKSVIHANGEAQMVLVTTAKGPESTDHENWLREADPDAATVTAHGVIEELYVEEKTPFRYVVRCEGGIVTGEGKRKCSFILRYYLFRGSARVKVEWTLIWESDPRKNFMRQCAIRFPATLEGAAVQITRNGPSPSIKTAEEVSIVATRLDTRLHQVPRRAAKPVEVTYWQDAQDDRTMIGAGSGKSGWLDVRMPDFRFAIAGERFAERYPKEITVSDLDVTYSLWPASTNQILDLRQFDEEELGDERNPPTALTGHPAGLAITEQIWLDFSADAEGEDLKTQAESTLILKAKPSHYVESGVFGPLYQRDAGLFPEYEGATDLALQWLMRSPAEFKWYGLLNDGGALAHYSRSSTQNTSSASSTWKCRSDSGWHIEANNESWQILLHWLRTGNDDYFQFFQRLSAHSANAGMIHRETENSIQVNSNGLPAAGASRRSGAAPWGQPTSGDAHGARSRIFWYLLSGHLRSLELFADNLRFMLAKRNPSPLNVAEMTLGYELFDGISRNSRSFVTRRLERLQRFKKRAIAKNWKQCAAAASNYLALEKDYFSNPNRILERAREAVHSSRSEKMDPSARSQFAEGLLHFAMAHAEDAAERKTAHETILRIAEIEMEGAGEAAFSGKAIAFAHAIQPKAAYVSWTKKQLTEMFDEERMDLLSLKQAPVSRLSYQELWRRLSLHPNLSAHQTSQLYGRLIGRVPWFMQVIEADAKLEKLRSVKTRLAVTATALSEGVRIAWKGQIGWDATGFELHRRKGHEGEFSVIETLPDRKDSGSYFDNKIEAGRSYQYLLHVRNRDGKVTPYGEPLTVTPLTWVRRINCGGPEVTTPDGRLWEADKARISGAGIWSSRSPIHKAGDLQNVYKTERWAKASLTYTFDAKPGRYKIILHLAETNRSFSVRGKRVYEVRWNERRIAGPVDVFRAAGKNTAWQLEKTVDLKTTPGKLVLKRIRGIGPAVKGIEVMSSESQSANLKP